MRRLRKGILVLLASFSSLAVLFPARPGGAAVMSDYCQVPPFVISNIAPNVMLLVSNSSSMLKFAYVNSDNCSNATPAQCGPVDNTTYGYFEPGYWYSYSGSGKFQPTVPKSTRSKADTEWDGSFLNWLTMRRIDVLRRALTGGTYNGRTLNSQITYAGGDTVKYLRDSANAWTPTTISNNKQVTVTFTTATGPSAAATTPEFTLRWVDSMGVGVSSGPYKVNVDVPSGATIEGVLQGTVGARARIGLTFFNDDSQGGNVDPAIGFSSLSGMVSRINTPSNIVGGPAEPLAEAMYTIAGYFAQTPNSTGSPGLGLSNTTCIVAPNSCNPRYHLGANADMPIGNNTDPYNYGAGGTVRYPPCAKSFVLIIADGEPCGDGNIPTAVLDNADWAPYRYTGPLTNWCGLGGAVAGAESLALWAHTTDLRSATIGRNPIDRTQNLTFYVIQAFGSGSGILKQVAINGGFEDSNNNKLPDVESEYNSGVAGSGNVDTYFAANGGNDLVAALKEAFSGILRRASSGTAASVLASGEGSGANLVQAVFYPRRRFGNDVIMWTGSLQNLWYYVDPYLANASIHEDTQADKILALDNDYLVQFVYDTDSDTTSIALRKTTATGAIDNAVPVITRSFEEAKSLWEAGNFLYATSPGLRHIYSIDDNSVRRDFTDTNYSYFQTPMDPPIVWPYTASDLTRALIAYVRGTDDSRVRPRTVPVNGVTSPDNVWKLGDIIYSTPRIAGGVPLNGYYRVYKDWTYKSFTDNTGYANRGVVFTGGNDGMLHAFKLGKLDFDGAWRTSYAQKAKLSNFGDNAVALGKELWAYVPRSALPYLKYLPDNNYCHLYYADLSPFLFDASIGTGSGDQSDDVRTPDSWRTILIGGMRTGGACRAATGTCNSTTGGIPDCVKAPGPGGLSSYFAIDITNQTDPKVLWEFSSDQLGFATTGPAIVRISGRDGGGNADSSRNGHWFVVFGSGPTGPIDNTYNQFLGRSDQPLRLFVLPLKTGTPVVTIDHANDGTTIPNAFAGSMLNATADFDLDYQDDAVFFGYVKKDDAALTWTKGGVGRLATHANPNPATWTLSRVIDDIGPVTSSVVRLQNNATGTNWLYFGEGRYYYERDLEIDDANGQRRLYGIKDPCFRSSNLYRGGCSSTAAFSSLTDQTTIDNTVTDAVANDPSFAGWYVNLSADNTTLINYGDGGHRYWAERVITDPLSVNTTGIVFFTAYRPYNEMCNLGGKSFLWAIRYNTGGAPPADTLQGKALIQVSTASVEQIDLRGAFSGANSQGGRRSGAIEGVPPIAQGLSILTPPPPVKKILHMKEH